VGYTVYAGSVAGYMMFNFRALQSMNKFYIYPREITKYLTNITSNLLVFRTLFFLTYDAVQPDNLLQTFRRNVTDVSSEISSVVKIVMLCIYV